jgi:hypothetical protein
MDAVSGNEPTTADENVRYKWGFMFVTFALFLDVMGRSVVRDEAAWDLLALAILPGLFCGVPARQNTSSGYRVRMVVLVVCLAGIIGAVTAYIIAYLR